MIGPAGWNQLDRHARAVQQEFQTVEKPLRTRRPRVLP
jgi:hypothetical protein